MKKNIPGNLNLIALALTFSLSCFLLLPMASAIPQIPTRYFGVITRDGAPASGIEVIAKDSDNLRVSSTVSVSDSDGVYKINVEWDDPTTEEDEGVVPGDELYFYIDGDLKKEEFVAEQGSFNEIDFALSGNEVTYVETISRGSGSSSSADEVPEDLAVTDNQTDAGEATDISAQEPGYEITPEEENIAGETQESTVSHLDTQESQTRPEATTDEVSESRAISTPLILTVIVVVAFILLMFMIKKRGAR